MKAQQNDVRKHVLDRIVRFMEEAMAKGQEPYGATRSAFPGVPDEVLWGAFSEAKDPRVEAWWLQAERTIVDEAKGKSNNVLTFEPIPAGSREIELDAAFEGLLADPEGAP